MLQGYFRVDSRRSSLREPLTTKVTKEKAFATLRVPGGSWALQVPRETDPLPNRRLAGWEQAPLL
jgi:hypothetical protein